MAIKLQKQTSIIIFYITYFIWLATITFLTGNTALLNNFTIGIALFYLSFLREKWDIVWFVGTVIVFVGGTVLSFESWNAKLNLTKLTEIPYWLPLAWATTVVALRKFYIIVSRREED